MLFNVDWSFPRIARVGSTPKGCNGWRDRDDGNGAGPKRKCL